MTNMLAAMMVSGPGIRITVFIIVMLIFYVGIPVLVISFLVRMIRYYKSAGNEQKLIRMELSKLADEVGQIRRELNGTGEILEKETGNGK